MNQELTKAEPNANQEFEEVYIYGNPCLTKQRTDRALELNKLHPEYSHPEIWGEIYAEEFYQELCQGMENEIAEKEIKPIFAGIIETHYGI